MRTGPLSSWAGNPPSSWTRAYFRVWLHEGCPLSPRKLWSMFTLMNRVRRFTQDHIDREGRP